MWPLCVLSKSSDPVSPRGEGWGGTVTSTGRPGGGLGCWWGQAEQRGQKRRGNAEEGNTQSFGLFLSDPLSGPCHLGTVTGGLF